MRVAGQRRHHLAAALAVAVGLGASGAAAQEPIRKLVLLTPPQASLPAEFQAAELVAQQWRKLGLTVEVQVMPRQQQSQYVWFERDKWDMTLWQMVGRPERSDPDEVVFNLFHSSTAQNGYNFVGYLNPDYDKLAQDQRLAMAPEQRKELVFKAQALIDRDQPYSFLGHPKNTLAFNSAVWKPDSIQVQSGISIRNFWTFIGAEPAASQKTMILNSTEALVAIHPLYISGATDSWVTELIWDRLLRIGPDGLPKPWAAEAYKWVDDKTIDVTLRSGMKWHDGQPVTVKDVVFSFQAPATGDKVPMYKPFVTSIASVAATDDRTVRFVLKQPNASFLTSSLAKINLVPEHIWAPVMKDLEGKPQTVEQIANPSTVGSGPFKFVRAKLQEEVVLDRNPDHWAAPKMERWILRVIPNVEATVGSLKTGELNLLGQYGGDPDVLEQLAKDVPAIKTVAVTDIGFDFIAYNERRAPFGDAAFRRALSAAVDRPQIVAAAYNTYAVASNSMVSPALPFWHNPAVDNPKGGLDLAKAILDQAGYKVVGGKLTYPAGVKEALK